MTVVRRIVAGYAGLMILMLIAAGIGVYAIVSMERGYSDFRGASLLEAQDTAILANSTTALNHHFGEAILFPDKYDQKVGELQEDIKISGDMLASVLAFEEASGDTDDVATLKQMQADLAQYETMSPPLLAQLKANPQMDPALFADLFAQSDKVIDATEELLASNQQLSADRMDALNAGTNRLLIIMLIVVAIAVAVGVALSVAISRSIARQLRAAVASIGSSAAEMLAIASQVAAGAAQTAASTNETTATVEEVKQTALLANEKASQVAESSQDVARIADTGRTAVDDTIAGIERMQDQMAVVAETINRLSDQTQAVGEIIATVSDLAEQSNLLSVNASIEAAKAGDHGKGFTVVAQEVKSLAEQSKQAVSQVRTILSEIQKAGNMAVQAAEQGREAIEAGRQQSLESGEAIQMLAETVTEAAQSAIQISASSRQQLAGMEQISQAIESINQASSQSVSGTRQVEQEVKQLQDLALTLRRLVEASATA